jgi:hypothetical protein
MSVNPIKSFRTYKPVKEHFSDRLSAQLKEFSDKIPESAGEAFSLTEKLQKLVAYYVMRLDKRSEKRYVYKSVINLLSDLANKSQGGAKVLILSSVNYWEIALRQENDILKNSVSNSPVSRTRARRRGSYLDYPVVTYRAKTSDYPDYPVVTYQPETAKVTRSMRIGESSKVTDLTSIKKTSIKKTLNKKTESENLYTKK